MQSNNYHEDTKAMRGGVQFQHLAARIKQTVTVEGSFARLSSLKTGILTSLFALSVFSAPTAATAADYNWTFQTSETAGEPGFINKQKWAENVEKMSGGRIEIEILPIGAVVPHTDTLDAVGTGILQGHLTDPSYFAGKDPAFAMMGNLVGAWSDPFELIGFMQSGGGHELYAELVEPYGVHFIGAAATEPEAFVSSVPIRSVEDLKGVKMRAPEGMVYEIFSKAGASPVALPGSEVFTALDKGVVQAADYTVFATNQSQGMNDVAHYPLYPGFHSLPLIDISMTKSIWDELPDDLKAVLNASVDQFIFDHVYSVRKLDAAAVEEAKANPEIEIVNWSGDERAKFRRIAQQEWENWAGKNDLTQRYYDAVVAYLKGRNQL
ncbi:Lactate-binding periplasmic protein precursor [Labrenzia sp. THAF191b]|uniref:TRAP transporter substrate-binding protein n=1 Tax=unclassified Labrenzia TaxID=2648686 RepID=UPI0012A9ADD0|nr:MULTISPECIES: TRAP transporter substrate-binding protein [unclassified Labrenzia]QFS97693.1 Lactate-binding periplasmic protein precursor [Labrenzia sp. THAF191b]QFT04008.1 Lactate-binding periplasmic protein precursor [Labrenzia sp. THAF191a]QFT15550.1 Lactate-binding periplasmic protein precursor [Labrenzia sp. THAF187b]